MIATHKAFLQFAFALLMLGSANTVVANPQSQQPPETAPAADRALRPAAAVVWVNTTSGYYHRPDSRHYGQTKYRYEADAFAPAIVPRETHQRSKICR